tara:strand:- start:1120 stop:1671 length:552 start_codon:yes stop_codon:yes gene_type:complete
MSSGIIGTVGMRSGVLNAPKFPDGHVVSSEIFLKTEFNSGVNEYSTTSTSFTVIADSTPFATISGNTYVITCTLQAYIAATGSASQERRGYFNLYKGTDKDDGDTSSLGDLLCASHFGAYLVASSSQWGARLTQQILVGGFVASATETNYLTIAMKSSSAQSTIYTKASATEPQVYSVIGYQG